MVLAAYRRYSTMSRSYAAFLSYEYAAASPDGEKAKNISENEIFSFFALTKSTRCGIIYMFSGNSS